MQNAAVAAMFDEIADLLEIAGENPFQTRAYRKAAEAVSNYLAPIEDASVAELRAIPGLGPATSDKTREFLATGRVSYLEKLRDEYPRGLLELRRVPGLGPKKVAVLYRERGISSIETLEQAIAGGELNGLAGFGPKTVVNIQAGLKRLAEMNSQLPLIDGLPVVQMVARVLADVPGVETVEIAGEARRGCESLSSFDWVAQSDDPAPVLAAFVNFPSVAEVLEQGDSRAVVRMRPGLEATLRVVPAGGFGSGLFFATGSRAHIEEAERRATAGGVNLEGCANEEQLYAALGVPYLDPELRENNGEWALQERPELVKFSDYRGDLHAHSTWSDGLGSIREMAAAALARGYSYHAVTDHSRALAMANGLDAKRLREQAQEIAEVQADFPTLKILRGIECDIMRDGSMDLDDDILHEVDWVIGSVHSAFNLDEAAQTERIIRAISNPAVDMIAHPTGRIVGARPAYDVNINAIIEAARETATALEINASQRLDLKDEHARMAREAGVLISTNTDAHSVRMLGNIGIGILTARRAWCRKEDVLNTKTTEELMAWLGRAEEQR